MTGFVVFRECRGFMVWYVDAVDATAATERVWPADPSVDPRLSGQGGMEAPHVEASLDIGPKVWARPILGLPRGIAAAYDEALDGAA